MEGLNGVLPSGQEVVWDGGPFPLHMIVLMKCDLL